MLFREFQVLFLRDLLSHCLQYCILLDADILKVDYLQTSTIRRTKSQNLDVSRFVLQLSLPNPVKLGVKSRIKL